MTRKIMLIIAVLLIPLLFIGAVKTPSPSRGHTITGIIRTNVVFSLDIFDDVLPFDLDSTLVNFNPSSNTLATGLRIGTYTLVSHSGTIKLAVEHTPLVHNDATLTANNSINYRLYLMTEVENPDNANSPSFISTTGASVELLGSSVATDGTVSLVSKYIYVTLDEGTEAATNNVREALESGVYRSDIKFSIWVAE